MNFSRYLSWKWLKIHQIRSYDRLSTTHSCWGDESGVGVQRFYARCRNHFEYATFWIHKRTNWGTFDSCSLQTNSSRAVILRKVSDISARLQGTQTAVRYIREMLQIGRVWTSLRGRPRLRRLWGHGDAASFTKSSSDHRFFFVSPFFLASGLFTQAELSRRSRFIRLIKVSVRGLRTIRRRWFLRVSYLTIIVTHFRKHFLNDLGLLYTFCGVNKV